MKFCELSYTAALIAFDDAVKFSGAKSPEAREARKVVEYWVKIKNARRSGR